MTRSPTSRTAVAVEMGLREYARTPVLLALLVFLPAYFVGIFVYVIPSSQVPVHVPGDGLLLVETVELFGILLVPLVAGLIGGLAGLFSMLTGSETDARLVAAGFDPWQFLLARYALVLVAGLVATGVALAVLSVETLPDRLDWYLAAAALLALTYGLLGALASLVVSRLAGVYAILVVPMIDVGFFQNPMIDDPHWIAAYLPGHYATALAVDAGLSETVSTDPLWGALASLSLVVVLTTAAYYRSL